MAKKSLFDIGQKKSLFLIYHKYLARTKQQNTLPNWNLFYDFLRKEDPAFNNFKDKQINNKIIDYRKISGYEIWPNFKNFLSSYTIRTKKELLEQYEKDQEILADMNMDKDLSVNLLHNSEYAMLSAIEIHNKPIIKYRYQVVTILIINAWELLLKSYINKYLPKVRLFMNDGSTKPFLECLSCVVDNLGKDFFVVRENLKALYRYRCKYIHLYDDDWSILIFGLLQKNISLYNRFLKRFFKRDLSDLDDLFILPIAFKKPLSPIDFITNKSALEDASEELVDFIKDLTEKIKNLNDNDIGETILVPYSVAYKNEKRLKNADIIAAINDKKAVHISLKEDIQITDNPEAKKVKIKEESLINSLYNQTYQDVVSYCKSHIADWKQNKKFHDIMKILKAEPQLHYVRRLDPNNPKSAKKDYYSKSIYEILNRQYRAIDKS